MVFTVPQYPTPLKKCEHFSQCIAVLVFGGLGGMLGNFYSAYLLCCCRVLSQGGPVSLIDDFSLELVPFWKLAERFYISITAANIKLLFT